MKRRGTTHGMKTTSVSLGEPDEGTASRGREMTIVRHQH